MPIRVVPIVLLAGTLAGCLRVHIPEDAYFISDARLAAEGQVLPQGGPLPEGTREIRIPYAGGEVAASYIPGRAGGPLILFCGGNMFRRGVAGAQTAERLTEYGDVLMFDYPGYGQSPGESTIATFTEAAMAVADRARDLARAEGRRLVPWGHSLGGPICAEVARHVQADALVLEATTPSARAAVNDQVGLLRPLLRVEIDPGLDSFDIVRTLDGFQGRVLVLEASHDDTLAPRLSRNMARDLVAAGVDARRLVFDEAEHNNIRSQPDAYARITAALTD